MIQIIGEKWQCRKCGRYFYIQEGAGAIIVPNCPFCYQRTAGKFIQMVKIIL